MVYPAAESFLKLWAALLREVAPVEQVWVLWRKRGGGISASRRKRERGSPEAREFSHAAAAQDLGKAVGPGAGPRSGREALLAPKPPPAEVQWQLH